MQCDSDSGEINEQDSRLLLLMLLNVMVDGYGSVHAYLTVEIRYRQFMYSEYMEYHMYICIHSRSC